MQYNRPESTLSRSCLWAAGRQLPGRECVEFVIDRIKRREVYRHLSNAAERLARVGETLHDLSVKYA